MNRYWVGGTGNWNDTSHWSASSGGSGGASVPTSNDDVFIDSNSGLSGGTILVPYGDCNNLTCTSGHTYTIKEDDYGELYISGSLELEPGITWSSRLDLFFNGGGTIKTSGVKLGYVGIGEMLL